ncbi:MAG: hypothetical protein ABIG03_01085 [Candidatus Eisenbacteria bacterium]
MRTASVFLAAAGIIALVAAPAPAGCAADGPEGVLACYAAAFAGMDVAALERLLAEDYQWLVVMPPEVSVFSRADVIKLSDGMLSDADVESVSMSFADGYGTAPAGGADEWILHDVKVTLELTFTPGSEKGVDSYSIESCLTLYVRKVAGTESEYEVYREVNFEGLGCGR